MVTLRVIAPLDALPGQSIGVNAAGRYILVRLPDDVRPGQECEFRLPAQAPPTPPSRSPARSPDVAPRLSVKGWIAGKIESMRRHRRPNLPAAQSSESQPRPGARGPYRQFDDSLATTELYI